MVQVEYLADSSVDDITDAALRRLLSECFTGEHDVVFRERRYFHEMPGHRWVIRDQEGTIVAHAAVHEKSVTADKEYRIGGIAEVCVKPEYRGKGYVKRLMQEVECWLRERDFDFAVLFGSHQVYASSGYRTRTFVLKNGVEVKAVQVEVLAIKRECPVGDVYLEGPQF